MITKSDMVFHPKFYLLNLRNISKRFHFRSVLILISIILPIGISYAQSSLELKISEIAPASPEAIALAKYINYPVNYSTGLPSIEIPLYEINAGGLSLPISLNYHASGIKVYDSDSWVGMGWTLNAEPSISRSVKGKQDEDYYIRRNTPLNDNPTQDYKVSLANGMGDEQPDEFYYKLLSKSGGFYLQPKLSTTKYIGIPHPYEPIDIELLNISMNGFRIKDDDGTTYNFGTNNISQESVNNYNIITAWKADNITSAKTNSQISFDYFPHQKKYSHNRTDIITVEDKLKFPSLTDPPTDNCLYDYPVVKDYFGTRTVDQYGNYHYCNSSTVSLPIRDEIMTVKIKEITFNSGKVVFKKNVDGTLNFIEIYNNDEIIKKVKLTISPYSGFTNSVRPRLDKVEIMNKTGEVVEEYSFEYNTDVALPNPYNSMQVDHWGYYLGNFGSGNANTLVPFRMVNATNSYNSPAFEVDFPIGGINRSADPTASNTKAGILTKITYPTSGYTKFEYEANKYMDPETQTIQTAGGLRVSKISSHNPDTNKTLIRRLKYGESESGLGFITGKFDLDDYMIQSENDYSQYSIFTTRLRTYYGNSLKNLFFSSGAPTVYKEVSEYQEDISGNTIGKTVYKYNHYDFSYGSNRIGLTSVFIDWNDEWKRGELLSKTHYKYENGNYLPVSKVAYNYGSPFNAVDIPVGEVFKNKNLYWPGFIDVSYEDVSYYRYYIKTGAMRLTSSYSTSYVYEGGLQKKVETVKSYKYDNTVHLYPTQIKTTTSNALKPILNVNKYVQDVTPVNSLGLDPLTTTELSAIDQLKTNHRISEVIQTQSYLDNNNNGVADASELLNGQRTNYKIDSGVVQPFEFQSLKGVYDPVNNTLETRIVYEKYDSRGNPLEVRKAAGSSISYLWGYNGQYPIAKIENAKYADVQNALGFSNTKMNNLLESDFTVINNLRSQLPNAIVTTYEYEPLVGVTKITDPRGQKITYQYDEFNRLKASLDNDMKLLQEYRYHYKGQN